MKRKTNWLILAFVALTLAVQPNLLAQEKKQRPEPPGPDPVPAKTGDRKAPKSPKSDNKPEEKKADVQPAKTGNWYIRQSPQVLAALEPICKQAEGSTVKVIGLVPVRNKGEQPKQIALGTVVDAAGFIITKASTLNERAKDLKIEVNGKTVPAKLFGLHPRSDLAMLKVEPAGLGLKAVEWETRTPEVGFLLATPDSNSKPIGFGVLSVASREERDNRGFMGVMLQDPQGGSGGSIVTSVTNKSPAAYSGLHIGDLIFKVNGADVKNTQDLIKRVQKQKPGDIVKVLIRRNNKEIEKTIRLADRSALGAGFINPQETIAGNRLSKRRSGFDRVIQHDTVLDPEHMGGPVLDIHGKAIGINIAKNGRVATYALPIPVLQPVINDLIAGKLKPALVLKPKLDQIVGLIKEKEKYLADTKLKEKATELEKKLADAKKAVEEATKEYERLQKALEEAGKKKFRAEDTQKQAHVDSRRKKQELDKILKELDSLKKEKKAIEDTFK